MRIAAAKIALDDLAGRLRVIDRAERAGDGADFAAHALFIGHHLGAGAGVDADRIDRARAQTPGFVALGTGVWCKSPLVVEGENLDKRSCRVECPGMLERAGHFALETAGTLTRIDV